MKFSISRILTFFILATVISPLRVSAADYCDINYQNESEIVQICNVDHRVGNEFTKVITLTTKDNVIITLKEVGYRSDNEDQHRGFYTMELDVTSQLKFGVKEIECIEYSRGAPVPGYRDYSFYGKLDDQHVFQLVDESDF